LQQCTVDGKRAVKLIPEKSSGSAVVAGSESWNPGFGKEQPIMGARTVSPRQPSSERYLELLREFPLRPIHDDDEHRGAIEVIDGLIDRDRLTLEEEDYLEVLGLIVSAYEDSIYEHIEFNGVDRVRHMMEENGLSQADLARETGIPVQSLSDILNGKRRISPKVRGRLAERFGVPAFLFT
jgi:HTH-type transcriptional regulator / antitoxin HigA